MNVLVQFRDMEIFCEIIYPHSYPQGDIRNVCNEQVIQVLDQLIQRRFFVCDVCLGNRWGTWWFSSKLLCLGS